MRDLRRHIRHTFLLPVSLVWFIAGLSWAVGSGVRAWWHDRKVYGPGRKGLR